MVACSGSWAEDGDVLQGRGSRMVECSRMVGGVVRGDRGAATVADGSVWKFHEVLGESMRGLKYLGQEHQI
jgi:hypothetical protein